MVNLVIVPIMPQEKCISINIIKRQTTFNFDDYQFSLLNTMIGQKKSENLLSLEWFNKRDLAHLFMCVGGSVFYVRFRKIDA